MMFPDSCHTSTGRIIPLILKTKHNIVLEYNKHMIKTLFSLTLILASTSLFGQNDSLKNEILDYSNTKTELISKGRTLLLDKFLEGDYSKVKEIKNYLINDVENDDYLVLYPAEYWMILYWTQEYKELLNSIQNLDSDRKSVV